MARKKDLKKVIDDLKSLDYTVYDEEELSDFIMGFGDIIDTLNYTKKMYGYNQELKTLKKKYNITD